MLNKKIRQGIAAACWLCLVFLSSCFNTQETAGSEPENSSAPTAEQTTTTTAPKFKANPLTGIEDVKIADWERPVAFMIGNNDKSRPQLGIEKADMYFEAETEGGITRIMAVFAGAARVPEKLGPIRSARTPFIKIAESLGAIYCHAGGSRAGLAFLKTADVDSINALGSSGGAFDRDDTLKKTKGTEYSLLAHGSKLLARIKTLKFKTQPLKPSPFGFGETTIGSGAGSRVQVRFSGAQTVSFQYDTQTKLYSKYNGTLEKGTAHKSYSGKTLTVSNIIIMYDEIYWENETTKDFRLVSGNGVLVSGGASRQTRWNRNKDRLQFTERDGTPLNISPGKTYICLTSLSNTDKTILA